MGRRRGSDGNQGLSHSSSSSPLSSLEGDDGDPTTPDSQHDEHDEDQQQFDEIPGSILPDSYSEPGGIPIFKPTMDEFKSFPDFIKKVNKYGMRSGIIKVIPPKEWVDSLPDLTEQVDEVRIRHAIVQHINGFSGEYRQQNIEKQRGYTMQQWRELSESSEHLPPARRGQRRAAATRSSSRINNKQKPCEKEFDYRFDDSSFTPERCRELEKIYWKTLTYNTPLYGADLPGSLFTDDTKTWNVSKLDNILNNINVELPGVNKSYLYCGMWKSTFAWHLEDMDLYSINYLHFGAPKQWYSISQKDSERFYNLMKGIWPGEQAKCSEFLRHKTFHASPSLLAQHGIKVNKLLHYQNEFVITFPYGYHAGFNFGYNCAESVNFAIEDWIDIGRNAKKCTCVNDSVGIDMDWFVRRLNGEPSEEEYTDDDVDDEGIAAGSSSLLSPPLSNEGGGVRKRKRRRKTATNANFKKPEFKQIKKVCAAPTCALCPNTMDIETLKAQDGKSLVHRMCAIYTPETYLEKDVKKDQEIVMGLSRIPKARRDLKCLFCRSKYGACFQCSAPKCTRSYHATCAAPAGVYVDMGQNQDGDMTIEYRCRFHREKRPIDADLEADQEIEPWAHKLTRGDVVQAQFQHGPTSIFAGIVRENNHSEKTLLLDILPIVQEDNIVEVEYKYLLSSGGGLGTFGSLPTKTKSLMERDEQTQPRKAAKACEDGIRWDQVIVGDTLEFIEQAPAQMDKIWHYLGDASTEAYARYTDDAGSKVPNDPDTIEQNARRVRRQQILAKRAESAAKAALQKPTLQQQQQRQQQPLSLATLQYYYELVRNNPALQVGMPMLQQPPVPLPAATQIPPPTPTVATASINSSNNNKPLWEPPGHQVEPARD